MIIRILFSLIFLLTAACSGSAPKKTSLANQKNPKIKEKACDGGFAQSCESLKQIQ